MSATIYVPLPGNEALAESLSHLTNGEVGKLETRIFPDGETYLRFAGDLARRSVAFVCTLAYPNAKIPPLLFAARTARELGAKRIGLIAPYLCYMRQDTRFKPGEAVTSRHFADLISQTFDWLLTIDPHLHRYKALSEIYAIPARAVHAAPLLGDWITHHVAHPYLIGPDEESEQWVSEVAQNCGAPYAVLRKQRLGDRTVRVEPNGLKSLGAVTPVVIDDVISSGETMLEAVRIAATLGERKPLAMAVHGIFSGDAYLIFEREGTLLVTTNSIPFTSSQIDVAGLLAAEMVSLA
jgi:ribose-phosphate pyrophosphokinase